MAKKKKGKKGNDPVTELACELAIAAMPAALEEGDPAELVRFCNEVAQGLLADDEDQDQED